MWILFVPRSATRTLPLVDTHIPVGFENMPFDLPRSYPIFLKNTPCELKICKWHSLKSAMTILFSLSVATPDGHKNSPSSDPLEPNFDRNFPFLSKHWTRWLFVSEIRILLSESIATCRGELNFPSPDPYPPNEKQKVPSRRNIWTRWLSLSVTMIRSSRSTAIPHGPFKLPSCVPRSPNVRM